MNVRRNLGKEKSLRGLSVGFEKEEQEEILEPAVGKGIELNYWRRRNGLRVWRES